jgi:hypothetical protein
VVEVQQSGEETAMMSYTMIQALGQAHLAERPEQARRGWLARAARRERRAPAQTRTGGMS